MKISVRHLFLCAAAASFTLTPAVFAQDNKQPDPAATPAPASAEAKPDKSAEPAAPPPAADKPAPAPAVAPSMEEPAAPVATPAPETPAKDDDSAPANLRRLDEDDGDSGAPQSHQEKVHERVQRAHEHAASVHAAVRANRVDRDIVNVFSDSFLPKDEKVDNVVAVFGNSTAEGEATDSVVAVFGNAHASGRVGDAVVAVLGDNEVNGAVGDSAVAVLGNLTVDGHVKGDVVSVLGDIKFGPNAEVDGDVVCVGGSVTKSASAILHHAPERVGVGFMHGGAGLKAWVRQCFLYGRPLAFGPNLMWAWWIALGFLALYALLALIFGKGVNKCVDTFEQRPGFSILTALLTVLLGPIAIIVLAITGVGVFVIPFLAAALFFASLFGTAVMLAWIGRRIGKLLGFTHPALAVLCGGVIVLLLYTIPVAGFIVYKLLGWIGLGVVVYTLLGAMKRERPVPPVTPTFAGPGAGGSVPPVVPTAPVAGTVPGEPLTDPAVAAAAVSPTPAVAAPVALTPPVLPAAMLPRAGFWIRLAALLLDVVIVAIICSLLSGFFPTGSHLRVKADLLPSLALYGALMWKLRGTTVGGIVCGLKVIRLDDRPIDWGTAIVRALSCFLSLFVMGLGFIWVVFDDQRQSWHDKIAGTTVVRVPKGVSLV
jgi:uncharacterized RDD family membrane protein YckC